jgi:uncharacterized protein
MPLTRRDFLKFGLYTLSATVAATLGGMIFLDESNNPVVEDISIQIPDLHPDLEGFTITQMSDIHLRPYTKPALVERAVEMANERKPDLAVLTGDFVWQSKAAAFELAPILAGLNARYGIYSVMGNHDYWLDIKTVQAAFDQSNLPVLYNQGVALSVGKTFLYLAGMDDAIAGHADLRAALERAPEGAPVVLLLHEPDLIDQTSLDPRVTLQLSGHTHGGQVLIPGKKPFFQPEYGKKYPYGLYKVNNSWLYTNRGLGCISVPLRINCAPEISLFTLTAA